ncbi:MAG: AMP-binding protein [Alphaproteobacteria bacterium]|nr:AMP-binding protein [Alphaproteobacteria bacterium]
MTATLPGAYLGNHLAAQLRAASVGREGDVFVIRHPGCEVVSFGEFFSNAEKLAAALVEVGVCPGDRVAVQVEKSVAMLELYVATLLAGAVFLPLNPGYTTSEVSYFLGDATPKLLVCDPSKIEALGEVARAAQVADIWSLSGDETGSLIAARDAQNMGFEARAHGADDLAATLYTSGTTGRSKGAMLSHGALASNSQTLKQYWRFSAHDVLIHALPIFHTHGLFVATNITLMAGGRAIFMPRFDAAAICSVMPEATAMMGVPTFYTRLLNQPSLAHASRNMRLFISGSAPLLSETHERWREVTGHAILERYGMTETNMNTSNPYDGARRAGTVGLSLPGVEVIVTDPETGERLGENEIGMLEVRGPNLFAGYWQMPEKTAQELRASGFFITGDLGIIDGDGYVSIVGRQNDMIISGGLNIYPKELELLLDGLPGVLETAVIGVPHPDFGEAVVAVLVPRAGEEIDLDDVRAGIETAVAKFKRPKHYAILTELPRNTMGKVQKKSLREEFLNLFG